MPDSVALPKVEHRRGDRFAVALGPLELAPGERLVLFGPNGAGKSTALRLLAGTIGERQGLPSSAYLPQRPYMFRGSAAHNLGLGLDPGERRLAADLVDRLGLDVDREAPAASLSGGERQRLALARTLAVSADLVLLDEPLSAVDVRHRERVTSVVSSSLGDRAAVIVTHDRDVVATLADRVAVMIDGTVRQVGTVDDVFTLPADDEVAGAVGIGNVLGGTVVGREAPMVEVAVDGVTIWGFGDQAPGTPVKVLFGAETVTVYRGAAAASSARNAWAGTIEEIRRVGRLVEIVVDVGPRVAALITPGSFEALGLGAGSEVGITLKATAARAVSAPQR